MFNHHEGRYMKYNARKTDIKTEIYAESKPKVNLHVQPSGICHIII